MSHAKLKNLSAGTHYIVQILLALAVIAYASSALPVYAAKTQSEIDKEIKQQEQEYKKIQGQISQTKKKINEAKKKESNVSRQIEELSQRITITQQRVNVVNLHIRKLHGNIVHLTGNIAETEQSIKNAEALLADRMVTIYKYGGIAEFNLLLSSKGADDALRTSYLLGKIAEQDQALINDLADKKRRYTEAKAQLTDQKEKFHEQGKVLNVKKNELRSAADERNAILAKVRRDKALYIAQQQELLKASRELQSAVKRLLAEKRKLNAKKNPGKKPTVYYTGGRLAWPTRGSISSEFGTRVHPIFKTKTTHTGLDISAPKGTPVTAADAGEVLYTGWMRGYGQVIIIDHGGSLTTVYAHLSQINCTEDAKVAKGALIGRVGSTGVATGNHLHFEVRVNGDAVNPMRYLR